MPVIERTFGCKTSDNNPVPHPKSNTSISGLSGIWQTMARATSSANLMRGGVSKRLLLCQNHACLYPKSYPRGPVFLLVTVVLGTGVLKRYFFKLTADELSRNIRDRSGNGPINFDPALI